MRARKLLDRAHAVFEAEGLPRRQRGFPPRWPRSTFGKATHLRPSHVSRLLSIRSKARSRTRTLPSSPPNSAASSSRRRTRAVARTARSRSTSRRRSGFAEPLAIALRAKGALTREALSTPRGASAHQTRSLERARARARPGTRASRYFTISDRSLSKRAPHRRARLARREARLRAEDGVRRVHDRGESSWSGPISSLVCLGAGTRRSPRAGVHRGADRIRRARAEPAPVSGRGSLPTGRCRRSHNRRSQRSRGSRRSATSRRDRAISAHAARVYRAEGKPREALVDAEPTLAAGRTLGIDQHDDQARDRRKRSRQRSQTASTEKVKQLLANVESAPPGARPPYLDAHAKRMRARLDARQCWRRRGGAPFRRLSMRFWLAVTLLEHAELIGDEDRRSPRRARSSSG